MQPANAASSNKSDAKSICVRSAEIAKAANATIKAIVSEVIRPSLSAARSRPRGNRIRVHVGQGAPFAVWPLGRLLAVPVFCTSAGRSTRIGPQRAAEIREISWDLAEGVGFEPTIRVNVYTLSKRAPSATRPSLRTGFRTAGKLTRADAYRNRLCGCPVR